MLPVIRLGEIVRSNLESEIWLISSVILASADSLIYNFTEKVMNYQHNLRMQAANGLLKIVIDNNQEPKQ
ncbi:hypothetical protein LXL04_019871 [Taraxacum kok-saghyz]